MEGRAGSSQAHLSGTSPRRPRKQQRPRPVKAEGVLCRLVVRRSGASGTRPFRAAPRLVRSHTGGLLPGFRRLVLCRVLPGRKHDLPLSQSRLCLCEIRSMRPVQPFGTTRACGLGHGIEFFSTHLNVCGSLPVYEVYIQAIIRRAKLSLVKSSLIRPASSPRRQARRRPEYSRSPRQVPRPAGRLAQ